MRWRIELLGGLRARQGSRSLARFRSQKTGVLLGYLARHLGWRHAREVLVELLWPGCHPEAGRNSLSTALWSLRRQLEPPGSPTGAILLADRNTVGLNPESVETDVAEFEDLLRAAAGAEREADRVTRLADAVELYGGDFMAAHYEDWILLEQQRLADAFHGAVRTLLTRLEAAGDVGRAMEYASRAVRTDPLREEAHCDLIWKRAEHERTLASLRAEIGEATFSAAWKDGWESAADRR
ncbi:MAG: hypothetical protein FJ278_07355 [Planctomycetes bacterium]|nr:hypothetical protein [Planctomycetota bacterium]